MGTFQAALNKVEPTRRSGKRDVVKQVLKDKGDGSLDEFLAVMADYNVPARAITKAIEATTGIKTSESMILRWRNSEWPTS